MAAASIHLVYCNFKRVLQPIIPSWHHLALATSESSCHGYTAAIGITSRVESMEESPRPDDSAHSMPVSR